MWAITKKLPGKTNPNNDSQMECNGNEIASDFNTFFVFGIHVVESN